MPLKQFKTLSELMIAFKSPKAAVRHFEAIRWKNGKFCPHCGHDVIYSMKRRGGYRCAECKADFSITVGTIFEDTKLPLRLWFGAIWLITNHPKGIASTTLARDLGVTQKTAWFMLHRLRHAARTKSFNARRARQQRKLGGKVEVDETFVGGKAKNRHKSKRDGKPGPTASGKTIVVGAVERQGEVVARVIPDVKTETLREFVRDTVSQQADLVVTDQWVGYQHLGKEYQHAVINHAKGVYVDGNIHTNTIEGVWAQLKRQINGTHHWVSPKHLQRYVDEMSWRINRRTLTAEQRVNAHLADVEGRLTYNELTA